MSRSKVRKKNARGVGKLRTTMLRTVRKNGNTLFITLPKPYCELHGLKAGDTISLDCNAELSVKLVKEQIHG